MFETTGSVDEKALREVNSVITRTRTILLYFGVILIAAVSGVIFAMHR